MASDAKEGGANLQKLPAIPAATPARILTECKLENHIAGCHAAMNYFNKDQLIFTLVVAVVMIGIMLYRVLF